jgi:uncharacterized protein (TIGR04255 family)
MASQLFSRAPLQEAIIDLRLTPRPDLDLRALEAFVGSESSGYPESREIVQVTQSFSSDGSAEETRKETIGYLSPSADGGRTLQAQLRGFTVSCRPPYPGWTSFSAEAFRLIECFLSETRPASVDQIAVRYVNRFDLPTTENDIGRFLQMGPRLPEGLVAPQFLMQTQLAETALQAILLLSAATTPPIRPGTTSVLLDIGLARQASALPKAVHLHADLNAFHDRIEEVFHLCMTDEARKLIE